MFDLDDTLCDYATARQMRLRRAFTDACNRRSSAGKRVDLEQMIADSIRMHPHGADHFAELFSRYGIDDPASAREAAAWYRNNRFFALNLFPEARKVLLAIRHLATERIRPRRRPMGIITNGPAEVQRAKLELMGVFELVDFAVISEDFGVAKPDPAIFQEALHKAGSRADQAVYIGDSVEFDMTGARAAGIPSVWLNRYGASWSEMGWSPDRQIASLQELPRLVASGVAN
ncbi:MAG: HAD family hydrolase [Chloroflexia bacterium]|nr:HAD family hydrolase [Chloroflexia bacterium]